MLPSANVLVLIAGIITVILCYSIITGVWDKVADWWKKK